MKTLIIDTSSNKEILVGLKIDNKEFYLKKKINFRKAQAVLPMIDSLLKKHKVELKNINKIKVNTDPHGSFTGIRVGLSIANALSFVLRTPVLPLYK